MKLFIFFLSLIFIGTHCKPKQDNTYLQFPGKPEVPSSIKKKHAFLLDQIHQMTLFRDSTGRIAIKLQELMKHHFEEEENYVLPPLGLLPTIAQGTIPEQSDEIILLVEKFRSQYAHMSAEHQMIKAFLDELIIAATLDKHDISEFVEQLHEHANTEEEVLFPATILVGEYLSLKTTNH